MSLLNAGLKLAISALNLVDVFKALTSSGSKSASAPSLTELGQATSTTQRLVRDAVGTPTRQPHTRYRVGSTQRRQQLRLALSLVVVWTFYQSIEPFIDAIASYVVPFYSSLKTAFLLWILFGRVSASMRIFFSLAKPVLGPREELIDAVVSSTLGLFFNLTFLASLPLSWGAIHARRSAKKFVRLVRPAKAKRVQVDAPRSSSSQSSNGSPRMPAPPLSMKRRTRPPYDGPASQQRSRTTSLGMGRPPSHATTQPPLRSASSASSSQPSRAKHAPSPTTAMQALKDLPPAPTGFFATSQTGDGSFAFIPGAPDPKSEDDKLDPSLLPLSPFTPSVFPGGFGVAPTKRGPLRMPAGAKAKKGGSSFSIADAIGGRAAMVKQDAKRADMEKSKGTTVEEMEVDEEDEDEEKEEPLFRGGDEEPDEQARDQTAVNPTITISPSRRRRKESPNGTSALASASKRPKLEVFEDTNNNTSRGSSAGPASAAKRTRRATSRAASSRANSVAADGDEASDVEGPSTSSSRRPPAKRGTDSQRPPLSGLPRSVSTRGGGGGSSNVSAASSSGVMTRSTSTRTMGAAGAAAASTSRGRGRGGAAPSATKGRGAAPTRGSANGRGGARGAASKAAAATTSTRSKAGGATG